MDEHYWSRAYGGRLYHAFAPPLTSNGYAKTACGKWLAPNRSNYAWVMKKCQECERAREKAGE